MYFNVSIIVIMKITEEEITRVVYAIVDELNSQNSKTLEIYYTIKDASELLRKNNYEIDDEKLELLRKYNIRK